VSTGAQRATQTLACFAAMLRHQVPGGAVVEARLRSRVEDRSREAYRRAGSGDLAAPRDADPGLVTEDSAVLGDALRASRTPAAGRQWHSRSATAGRTRRPCWDLPGEIVEPLAKGAGVLVVEEGGRPRVEPLD
jgi:hypothetical protein